jgi:hypothetical protein
MLKMLLRTPAAAPVNTAVAAQDPDFFVRSGRCPQGTGGGLIRGTGTPHRLRTAGYGYSVRLHAGAARKDGCHPAGGLQIITGADAGERGGQPELGVRHEGKDQFYD